ncbi:MAG: amidohydrolase family protein [Syntrophobacteraceae bacterium]
MSFKIIDAHAHCGCLDRFPQQDIGDYVSCLGGSGIKGAVMFSPVFEIYDRYDPDFKDTASWRQRRAASNEYLLSTGAPGFEVYPYFFIWNDFAVEQLTDAHKGIKWHRHSDEPVYNYDDPRCSAAVEEIRRRKLPVCLEEEFKNTLYFINELGGDIKVIIPHCGMLNGGYEVLRRHHVWEKPNVWADTALASAGEIKDYILRYGHERIMFGSDFPFGDPVSELNKILRLKLNDSQKEAIIGSNAARLLGESNRGQQP